MNRIYGVTAVVAVALLAPSCATDGGGDDAAVGVLDTVAAVDTIADVAPDTETADTEIADTEIADTTATTDSAATDTALLDAESHDTMAVDSVAADVDSAVSDSAVSDSVETDTAEGDTAEPQNTAECPVDDMGTLFPGPLPASPFDTWPSVTPCIDASHDVAIVLGCPSNEDGTASDCQTQRADIAKALYEEGLAGAFIVSGAAVHNAYVEADALHALLVARGIPAAKIHKEPLAEHTDENLYYSTQIMVAQGWDDAWVVSEAPGHLLYSAVCDANCCVKLGRLTVFELSLPAGPQKIGHYALTPPANATTDGECGALLLSLNAVMCINLGSRKACADDFQL